jgi:hypothetical protein
LFFVTSTTRPVLACAPRVPADRRQFRLQHTSLTRRCSKLLTVRTVRVTLLGAGLSQGATISARKITAEIAHGESKAAWGKLDSNVLIGAVVISGAARTCLRKDRVAGHSALRAVQAFRPLVALIH